MKNEDALKQRFFGRFSPLFGVIVFLAIPFFLWSRKNMVDHDLWGHLRYGRQILTGNGIPHIDLYSWTALGKPWIYHEWLSDAVFAFFYLLGGSAGLILFKACLFALLCLLLHRLISLGRRPPIAHAVLFTLTVAGAADYFFFRPQLFTYLLVAAELLWILQWRKRQNSSLFALPLLFVLWANLHAGFLLGLLLIGIVFVCEALERFTSGAPGPAKSRLIPLGIAGAMSAGATILTPYGWDLWKWASRFFPRPEIVGRIAEWQPMRLGWDYSSLLGIGFIGVSCAVLAASPKRKTWLDIALVGLGTAMVLTAIRNIPLAWILGAYPLARHWPDWNVSLLIRRRPGLAVSFRLAGLGILALLIALTWRNREQISRLRYRTSQYPAGAVHFMKINQLEGRLFNRYGDGQYLIYHLAPKVLVSMDGRCDTVYSDAVMMDHINFFSGRMSPHGILSRYPADYLLLRSDYPYLGELLGEKWREFYRDDSYVLLGKKVPSRFISVLTPAIPWTAFP